MSQTFSIGCKACKKHLWIGQNAHIYGDYAHNKALAAFLHEHRGATHPLIFDEDAESLTFDGSTEIEVPE